MSRTESGARGVFVVALIALLTVALMPLPALAQDAGTQAAPEEPEKPWTNEAEVAFVRTGGNTDTTTFALRERFAYNWTYSEFVFRASLLRADRTSRVLFAEEDGIREELIDETTAEKYGLSAKFRRNILGQLFWFAGSGWSRDRLAGIQNRYGADAGAGYRFLEDGTTTVVGEVGAGIVHEEQTNLTSDTFAELRASLEITRQLSDTSHFDTALLLIENVQDFDDLRLNWNSALTAGLSEHFALRISFLLDYDNEPVRFLVEQGPAAPMLFSADKTDTTLSSSLVVTF